MVLGIHMFTLDVELLSGLEIDLKVAVLLYSKLLKQPYPYFYVFDVIISMIMYFQGKKLFRSVNMPLI